MASGTSFGDSIAEPEVNESSASPGTERLRAYKNNSLDSGELRRRREEEGMQLRRQKKEQLLRKRRNLDEANGDRGGAIDLPMGGGGSSNVQDPAVSSTVEPERLDPEIIEGLNSSDPKVQLNSTRSIRHILSRNMYAPIDVVVRAGVIPQLVGFLQRDENVELQFEATWCLTNVCSGDAVQTRCVVNAGCVPLLVRLLSSPSQLVREQAVWALGNIAGNGPEERDLLLQARCVPPLITIGMNMDALSAQMLRNVAWCIVNLVRYKNPPAPFEMLSPFLPCLACFLNHRDVDVLVDTCWALAHLSNGSNAQIQALLDAGVCPRLVELLLHEHLDVSVAALRAVGNLVTGDDHQTQQVLACGALPCLRVLLESGNPCCYKEVCWSLSNITAGNSTQVQQVMEAGLFRFLVRHMSHGDFKLRKEAAWSVVNACLGGLPEHVHALVADGCLQPLCNMLSVEDAGVVSMAISGIEAILRVGDREAKRTGADNLYALKVEECQGLDRIEFLQMHPNVDIYRRAYDIIDRFFGPATEEADSTVAPVVAPNQFEFHPPAVDLNGGAGAPFNF